jgi:TolB-like protein
MPRNRLVFLTSMPIITALLFMQACGVRSTAQPGTRILDPDADDSLGGTGMESQDIRSIAQRMSREILGINWPTSGEVPRIAILPINNATRFRVDTGLIRNKLNKELVNASAGRLAFLERESEAQILEERAKKQAGMYDSGNRTEAMAGADYFLRGEMRALSKAAASGVSDYIIYSFQLINAENGIVLWMGDYETQKAGETGVVYQ